MRIEGYLHHPTLLFISVFIGFILASRQLIFGFYTHRNRSSRDLAISTFLFMLLCLIFLLETSLHREFPPLSSILAIFNVFFVYRAIRQEYNIRANDKVDSVVLILSIAVAIVASLTLSLVLRIQLYTVFMIYLFIKAGILAFRNRQNVPLITFRGMLGFIIFLPVPLIIQSIRLTFSQHPAAIYSMETSSTLTTALMLLLFTAVNFSVQISTSVRNAEEIKNLLSGAVEEKTFATELVKIISHDLSGYLVNIRTALEIMADKNDPAIPMIKENARKVGSLLTDLIYWGRSRTSFAPTENSEDIVPAMQLLDAAADDVRNTAVSMDIYLRISGISDLVRADSVAVRVVLRNILSNALKYSLPGNSIRLLAERIGNEISICVSDSGPGMSESLQDSIRSGRFVRSKTGFHGEHGTGTGLRIVTSVCQANRWNLDISSSESNGTSITLYLPVVDTQ